MLLERDGENQLLTEFKIALDDDVVNKLKCSVYMEVADNERETSSTGSGILIESSIDQALRKERNRIHAKLSRDRSKLFQNKIQDAIAHVERQNKIMYNRVKASYSFKYLNPNELVSDGAAHVTELEYI
jgi:hypothetical protein